MSTQKKEISREAWLRRLSSYWNITGFPKFNTHAGEIYEVDFGENVGTEFSGRHLAICLRDTLPNQERCLVVPLSTKYESYNIAPSNIIRTYSLSGIEIKAGVVVGEARWISKVRIFRNSIILKEEGKDNTDSIVKGRIRITSRQINEWSKI